MVFTPLSSELDQGIKILSQTTKRKWGGREKKKEKRIRNTHVSIIN